VPGHKSLYGPPGTGALITPLGTALETLIEGGTGSMSINFGQPEGMPDRLESGTVNTWGIIGLGAGLAFVNERGMESIYDEEM
jgi:selenocysteine lyase/cysteine desulfurase